MVSTIFATKRSMTQAWTSTGKRVAVTRVFVEPNAVVSQREVFIKPSQKEAPQPQTMLEIGYGAKKLKNMTKPLRTKLEKSGFSFGVRQLRGVVANSETIPATGSTIVAQDVLEVGDVVKVQGVTKGRGFAGGMKRHGFHGGPRTHGQSDRARAVGSIGAGTDPGRVLKGKKMPGHYGVETQTVSGLVILHIDPKTQEVWLSGPVPGHFLATISITKTGHKKEIELDKSASGISEEPVVETVPTEVTTESSTAEDIAEEATAEAQAS